MRELPDIGLDWLLARCDEEGDCLLWRGFANEAGPQANVQGQQWQVRRLVWTLCHDNAIRQGWWIKPRCCQFRCVHPDCLKQFTRSEAMLLATYPADHARRVAMGRRANARIDMQDAQTIRLTSGREELEAVAAEKGISLSYAYKIRGGVAFEDFTSPFAGLGAR